MVIVPYEPENTKIVRRLLKDDIDLGLKDMRIRIVNASGDNGLGTQVADEMNLEGFNVVKVEDSDHKTAKTTEITEHARSPRVHARLQALFPDARFRDNAGAKGNNDFDITITLGTDRGYVSDRPAREPVSASRWEQPEEYPTYRNSEPSQPEPVPDPEPQSEPVTAPEPQSEPASEPPAPVPPPVSEPAAPAPEPAAPPPPAAPVAAPPPAPVAPPPAPVVAPPPAAPAPVPEAPAPVATPIS